MIVECKNCGVKYRLDDSKVKPEGVKVRCSRCGYVFRVFPEVERPVAELQERVLGEERAESRAAVEEKVEEGVGGTGPLFEVETPEEEKGAEEEDIFPFFQERIEEAAEAKPKSKLLNVFLVLLFAIILVFALLYIYKMKGGTIPVIGGIIDKATSLIGGKEIRKLNLMHLKGYVTEVDGKKVFVIQGVVRNKGRKTVKFVKLKGILYNRKGEKVAEGIGYSGRHISLRNMRDTPLPLLENLFSNPEPTGVTPVAPHKSFPFTIIFFSPPSEVAKYQVKVIEAPLL